MKAIPKIEWVDDEPVTTLYFPEMPAQYGKIAGWSPTDGHFEADLTYFWQLRAAKNDADVALTMARYMAHYKATLRVAKRDTHNDRQLRWKRPAVEMPC